jgi:hypothetical protein
VRKDYEPGVLTPSQKFASELAARDAFNREHPPLKGLVVPCDPRKMELPERPWRNSRGQWFDLAGWRRIWTSNGVRIPPSSSSPLDPESQAPDATSTLIASCGG